MNSKRHVLLVISRDPIDLKDLNLEQQDAVEHLINEELEIHGDGNGKMFIVKSLPEQTLAKASNPYEGRGGALSVAITDWLYNVCGSPVYEPLRNRRRREADRREKEKRLLDAFGTLVYNMHDYPHKPDFEFRLPKMGEKVLVQHGFSRCGVGTVKYVDLSSVDEKVIITIHGNRDFDIAYTFDSEFSHWKCIKGESKIDTGCSIAIYPGHERDGNPDTFIFIFPPTDTAKKMAEEIYLERMKRSIPPGQASPL